MNRAAPKALRTLDRAELSGKRVLVRVDLNVPMRDGVVADDARLRACLPTIIALRGQGARTILISHYGRPGGERNPSMSLRPLAAPLSELLGAPVAFAEDCIGPAATAAVARMTSGDVLLLENLRFHPGEEADDPVFARALAANGDLYVDDAFSAAHRAHASTVGLPRLLPAYAGNAMRGELEALGSALDHPARPVMGLVGGSKVSTKLGLLRNLVLELDCLAIGGGMANTFLLAQGWSVGASQVEADLVDEARGIIAYAEQHDCRLLLPCDVVVAQRLESGAQTRIRQSGQVRAGEYILDLGPLSVRQLMAAMDEARTLIWNGPLGVFELPPFDRATAEAARHAASRVKAGRLAAIAGGGDTDAALEAAGVAGDFTFVSTAGGAFLEWMEGKTLPGIAALEADREMVG